MVSTTLRPKPKVMRLSDAAAERVREIMANSQDQIAGVRIGVKNGGCAGMAYTMDYAKQADPLDEVDALADALRKAAEFFA
jgi:iron-sulfur cluster assembly protein